ncbi:MAG: 50S ribosomal protein L25 [Firmicutes bacterium]|nr:50S ribosomal protein L25 [Bacillota bacterium]
MAEQVQMEAKARVRIGSSESRRLRKEGWVPGILYGPELEAPLPLQISVRELHRVLPRGQRGIIQLLVEEAGETKNYPVMIKEIERDIFRDDITHLDFYQISLTRKVTTSVPINLIGTAPGTIGDGVLQHQLWEIEIECLPGQLPDYLEGDISQLEIGDVLTVSELVVPEGVEILTPLEDVVASVVLPAMEEEEEEVEEIDEELEDEEAALEEDEEGEAGEEEKDWE